MTNLTFHANRVKTAQQSIALIESERANPTGLSEFLDTSEETLTHLKGLLAESLAALAEAGE